MFQYSLLCVLFCINIFITRTFIKKIFVFYLQIMRDNFLLPKNEEVSLNQFPTFANLA